MKKPTLWERYLTKEIGIEFKACLYFFAFLFFYCTYRVCTKRLEAEILHMAEMIFLAYIIGYVQVFVLWNFDEADSLRGKELFGIGFCSVIYGMFSYLLDWFDRNLYLSIGFVLYVVFLYVCVFMIYKCRRKIDDKILNSDLELFKTKPQEDK